MKRLAGSIALVAVFSTGSSAQEPVSTTDTIPRNQLSLTAHGIGLTAGYARFIGAGLYLGTEFGVGGDFLSVMVLGGRHFGQWLAWEERDASGGELLFEFVHLGAFVRRVPNEHVDYDFGLRASAFLHFDDSDDDPGGGAFAGAYGTVMVGWKHFKLGPRVQAGLFTEGVGTREFGIYLAAITARVTFIW